MPSTWRNLPDERKAAVVDKASALELMLENTPVIKRPVLEGDGALAVVSVGDIRDEIRKLLGPLNFASQLLQAIRATSNSDDLRALSHELNGQLATDAAGGTGQENSQARQFATSHL